MRRLVYAAGIIVGTFKVACGLAWFMSSLLCDTAFSFFGKARCGQCGRYVEHKDMYGFENMALCRSCYRDELCRR